MILEKDVNFDGNVDVLVALGCFGEFEDIKYKCYIGNSSEWKYCSGFETISNPQIFSDSLEIKREDNYTFYDEIFFDIMFNRERENIKSAYGYIVDSYEKIFPSACTYDLIHFDNDDIPELVVGMDGAFVSMYTYRDGAIYPLIHQWSYGAGGNSGYEYIEKQGLIRNYNSDYAGLVMYTTYYEITDAHEISVKYFLESVYEDESGNILEKNPNHDEGKWKYYYSSKDGSKTSITEEEFQSYTIDGDYVFLDGEYSKEEVMEKINYLPANIFKFLESDTEAADLVFAQEDYENKIALTYNIDMDLMFWNPAVFGIHNIQDIP